MQTHATAAPSMVNQEKLVPCAASKVHREVEVSFPHSGAQKSGAAGQTRSARQQQFQQHKPLTAAVRSRGSCRHGVAGASTDVTGAAGMTSAWVVEAQWRATGLAQMAASGQAYCTDKALSKASCGGTTVTAHLLTARCAAGCGAWPRWSGVALCYGPSDLKPAASAASDIPGRICTQPCEQRTTEGHATMPHLLLRQSHPALGLQGATLPTQPTTMKCLQKKPTQTRKSRYVGYEQKCHKYLQRIISNTSAAHC
jgi:hypothetical protein